MNGPFSRFDAFCVVFADSCGHLQVVAHFFCTICGRFVICTDLRLFARKTGAMTKTTSTSWLLEDLM